MIDEKKNCAGCIHCVYDLDAKEDICLCDEADRKGERVEPYETCQHWKERIEGNGEYDV